MSFLPAVKLWICVSVLASLAGWGLSAVGFLNRVGYAVIGVAAVVVFFEARARSGVSFIPGPWRWRKIRCRFTRAFPLMFLALALLVFLGGVLYPPTNHTGLSYRVPRVLHWLSAQEWHWIYTANHRMNNRACGIEWLSAPLLLFTKSDRGLFLLNFLPFVLLPGLIFSLLTRLGVRARVAWPWMWLMPTGYVFLLQAGSAGNDAYPVVYALAAMDFAARAWTSRRASDLWYSLLAVALLGGAKASNLPLTLPWLVLVLPLWRLWRDQPLGTARVAVMALLVSFVPTAILNFSHSGDFFGASLEHTGMGMKNPLVGIWGNAFLLAVNNLCPPFFPLASWWNQNSLQVLPGAIVRPLVSNFEAGFQNLWELPTEDWAGIGLGVTGLMLLSALWAVSAWRRGKVAPHSATGIPRAVLWWALITPWLALVVYGVKSGMVTPARLIAPYYPLLLPLLLIGAEQSALVRQRWWRGLGWASFLVAFVVLIVTPARPLWPAQTILKQALEVKPGNRLLERALATYSVYPIRSDPLPRLRALLPPDLKMVGFLGGPDDLDISLWRPFGSRRVETISRVATAEQIRIRKHQYAVVSGFFLEFFEIPIDDWLARSRAELVASETVTTAVSSGPQRWYLVRFKD